MLIQDHNKNFYKFIETKKISFLNKAIKYCGFKKIKVKSFYNINNIFNLHMNIKSTDIEEYVTSANKNIGSIINVDNFKLPINAYILYYKKDNNIDQSQILEYIKYIQENMKNFPNCDVGILIYQKKYYSISKTIFNGIITFVETKK